jgi:O-antigen ligase
MRADSLNIMAGSAAQPLAHRILTLSGALVVAIAIMFPRAAAALFLLPVLAAVAILNAQGVKDRPQLRLLGLPTAILAFGVWALLSALWSAAPFASLTKPLFLIGGTLGSAVLFVLARQADNQILRSLARGILTGFVIGGGFVAFEILSDQALSRLVYNLIPSLQVGMEKHFATVNGQVVDIGPTNINRRVTLVAMVMIPAVLLFSHAMQQRHRWLGYGALAALAAVLMIFSGHQSSQAALVAGAGAFVLAKVSRLWALRLLSIAWCLSTIMVVPLVMAAHSYGLHHPTTPLPHSARHRVVIWNYTAEQVLKAPLLGIGADATATLTAKAEAARKAQGEVASKDGVFEKSAARHAHNVFLQIWYELGAVGAGLLTLIGLTALGAIARAQPTVQPYLMAQFAAVSGMIAFSFSIWQLWFEGAIGLGALALLLGLLLGSREETKPSQDTPVS